MLEGSRPDPEFFAVVAHRRHPAGSGRRSLAQESDGFLHGAKRNQVPQRLEPRKQHDALPGILRDVRAEQLPGLEPRGKKMNIIHERVGDSRARQHGRKLRLPDALGQPRSCGRLAKMFFEVVRHEAHLFLLVLRRNGDKHGLVLAAAHELRLPAPRKFPQQLEKLRMLSLDPFEQRP